MSTTTATTEEFPGTRFGELSDYASDMLQEMLSRERSMFNPPNQAYMTFRHRRTLVDWMSEMGTYFHFQPSCIHTSISYLDRILSSYSFKTNELQLVAMGCLMIAAKFEEKYTYVPTVQDLCDATRNLYSNQAILNMEIKLLEALNWQLSTSTPAHFLGMYLAASWGNGEVMQGNNVPWGTLKRYLYKHACFYADLCLQQIGFSFFLPSHIAASSMCCARKRLAITPLWPDALRIITGKTLEDIDECVNMIQDVYKATFPQDPVVIDPSPPNVLEESVVAD
eukprot:comp9860_c0_seq1/m.11567 comp9860_c0_seq1/g.11567  ORF comp9860_c0_seq1/g.11567 comp9860_c0_seq1/m.11567 type:complete len:281 (-) comp9860_c0_seq1:25-867(-)